MSMGASMLLQSTLERLDLRSSRSWAGENPSTWAPVSYLIDIFNFKIRSSFFATPKNVVLVRYILPKSVAVSQLSELQGHDAAESGSDQTTWQRPFAQTTGEELDVVDAFVDVAQPFNGLCCHFSGEVFPHNGPLQSTNCAVVIVGLKGVIST
jgi:hypothetical protein